MQLGNILEGIGGGGLLSEPQSVAPRSPLYDQLRAQWGGDWNISGIDRAQELADILQSRGITSLDGLTMGNDRQYTFNEGLNTGNEALGYTQSPDVTRNDGRYLNFGGTQVGNFGDRGAGNFRDVISGGPGDNEFGWSSAGHGAVGYSAVQRPDGSVQIVPNWNSSSDAAEVRDLALKAAAVIGGGLLHGAMGAGAGAGAGSAGGAIGAGEGAAQLAAWQAANPLTAAQVTAASLPAGGLPGLGSAGMFAGEGLAQLGAYQSANPLTAAQVTSSAIPSGGLPGLQGGLMGINAVPDALRAVESYSAANPVTQASVNATMPNLAPAVPTTGLNAMRQDEIANYGTNGSMPSSPAVDGGGSVWDSIQSTAGQVGNAVRDIPGVSWMKDNPLLGRLLMGGAGSLLSMSGDSGGSTQQAGPAKQWRSPIQGGLLSPVQQAAPASWARQSSPAGLLAQGVPNDGAWRYLKG